MEDVIKIHNQIKIIGVTGNIGSGKSTVCEILKSHGGYLISADEISHKIISTSHPVYTKLVETFGVEILKDDSLEIDRKKLAQTVFNNQDELDKLNKITHPYIIQGIINEIKSLFYEQEKYKYVVIDAPLLIETQMNTICDETWLICADEGKKIKRVIERDSLTENEIKSRLEKQISFSEAKEFATVIINNDGTREELELEVKKILDRD